MFSGRQYFFIIMFSDDGQPGTCSTGGSDPSFHFCGCLDKSELFHRSKNECKIGKTLILRKLGDSREVISSKPNGWKSVNACISVEWNIFRK